MKPIQSYASRMLSEDSFTSLKHLYHLNFSSRLVLVKKIHIDARNSIAVRM